MIIRNEKKEDYRTVEEMVKKAFWNLYVPGCTEHYFVHQVRKSRDYVPELDLKTLTVPLSRWKKDINIHKNYSIFIQDPMYAPDVFSRI